MNAPTRVECQRPAQAPTRHNTIRTLTLSICKSARKPLTLFGVQGFFVVPVQWNDFQRNRFAPALVAIDRLLGLAFVAQSLLTVLLGLLL